MDTLANTTLIKKYIYFFLMIQIKYYKFKNVQTITSFKI